MAAIAILDQVFLNGACPEPTYAARRRELFIVAVGCTRPGGTCFCASMGAGPGLTAGFDLGLIEMLEGGRHYFLIQAGSERGEQMLGKLDRRPATNEQRAKAEQLTSRAASQMGRSLNVEGLREALYSNLEHPRWDAVAERCLSCGNCTLVCPTCFCSAMEDTTDLSGEVAERWRRWDSCFTLDFTYIHGGSLRYSAAARYRHWVTHKLAAWFDQFGRSGCVGCGRCITWCPVGIDITQEAQAIRASGQSPAPPAEEPAPARSES